MSPAQKFSNSPSPARVESSAALAAQGVSARKEFGVDPHADGESSNFRDDASRPSAAPAGDLGAKGSSSHLVGSFRKLNPYPSIYTAQEIIYNASILFLHGAIYQLPSLPQLHAWISEHWEPLIMEEVGDALADFLMVDVKPSDIFHCTFARILIDLDISNGLPAKILLKSSKGSWVQSLDYEGIPFRCTRCFKTRHAAEHCSFEKKAIKATWWKGTYVQHYMVSKISDQPRSFFEVVTLEP
ncbi:uncharacterized protein LOC131073225 isoform X2 [Cryptomeria japonica]|nr:uncharacterized protein LOC131073225 isoform X2 [Cryptomeria japonica]